VTATQPDAALEEDGRWARRLPRQPVVYLAGIFIALFVPRLVGTMLSLAGLVTDDASGVRWNWLTALITVALLALFVVHVEKLPIRTLFPGRLKIRHLGAAFAFVLVLRFGGGPVPLIVAAIFLPRRPPGRGRELLLWALSAAVVLAVGMVLFSAAVDAWSLGTAPSGGGGRAIISSLSIAERLLLVVSVSFAEEVRYRSYTIERLHGLGLPAGLAALLSYIVFVAAHIPFFGLEHVLRVTAIGSVGFPILYYLTRSFWACVALHFLLDIFILAL